MGSCACWSYIPVRIVSNSASIAVKRSRLSLVTHRSQVKRHWNRKSSQLSTQVTRPRGPSPKTPTFVARDSRKAKIRDGLIVQQKYAWVSSQDYDGAVQTRLAPEISVARRGTICIVEVTGWTICGKNDVKQNKKQAKRDELRFTCCFPENPIIIVWFPETEKIICLNG